MEKSAVGCFCGADHRVPSAWTAFQCWCGVVWRRTRTRYGLMWRLDVRAKASESSKNIRESVERNCFTEEVRV